MANTLHIVLAQINFTLGDIERNADQAIKISQQVAKQGADLVVFPELTLTGYPPEDLLFRDELHQRVAKALQYLEKSIKNIDVIFGYPHKTNDGIYNAAAFLSGGKIQSIYHKQHLPNYSVFDEKRYFKAGKKAGIIHCKGFPIAMTICEDLWHSAPMQQAHDADVSLVICINASPFHSEKPQQRLQALQQRIKEHPIPIAHCHWVAGQDELVFDGGSQVLDAKGQLCAQAPFFQQDLLSFTIDKNKTITTETTHNYQLLSEEAVIYQALVLGVRDYVLKNGFTGALIGFSGGIDSALTLAIATDALGKDNVEAILMPSRYTADISVTDAIAETEALGVAHHIISIEPMFKALLTCLAEHGDKELNNITQQNLQARSRGVILMALSNQTGKMVLTTGNKSEMAVGYATLYGDMAGGFNVLKDVFKTQVYQLAHYRNSISPVIPKQIIERAPSAELAPNQTDQDTLPEYHLLDQILKRYIEHDQGVTEIVQAGFDKDTVKQVIKMVDRSEYKRRQAPPGVKVSTKAFGRDRRYPITARFNK